jgi:hypothetical protein
MPLLSSTEYLHRHNEIAKIIHQQLAFNTKLITSRVPYYKYTPNPVLENNQFKFYWDRPIITDEPINCNRPDIVLVNLFTKTAFIIDI